MKTKRPLTHAEIEEANHRNQWLTDYQARAVPELAEMESRAKEEARVKRVNSLVSQLRIARASARSWRQLADGLAREVKELRKELGR